MSGGVDGFDLVAFLKRAVLAASNGDVGEMHDPLVRTFEAEGIDPTMDDTSNTVASKGAAEPATHLVLSTHIDTASSHVPYDRDEDVIHGRGPYDARDLLTTLFSVFSAADLGPDARVTLVVTPGEELLSTGAAQLDSDGGRYIVDEPTGLNVCMATEGRFKGTMLLSGVATYATKLQSSANAVDALAPVLDTLRLLDDDREAHLDLGPATPTPMMVDGGADSNRVPADCRPVVDRWSVPSEMVEGFREELESTSRAAVPDDVGVDFALTERPTPFLEALATDPDHELVTSLAAAPRDTGGWADARPFTVVIEASYFSPAPVAVSGSGNLTDDEGAVAHVNRECACTDDVRTAATALRATVAALIA